MTNIGEQYQTADWKSEKHVPVIECPDEVVANEMFDVTVTLGKEVAHPNTTEHHTSIAGWTPEQIVSSTFTQISAFDELVRAAEGVPRDAIHIASLAAQYAVKDKISIQNIRRAAKNWYQTGKEAAIHSREEAMALLHWIVDKVIANRKARAFMLRSNVKHPLIEDLFDSRVLHLLKKGISTHDEPGARYDAYKLDYGCYVDLMATSRAPVGLFRVASDDDPSNFVEVPMDDYRSIRRAILDLSEFERIRNPFSRKA